MPSLRLLTASVCCLALLLTAAVLPSCTNFAGYAATGATEGVYTAAEPPVNKYDDGDYVWYELPVAHYRRTDALFRTRPLSRLFSGVSVNMGRRLNEDGTQDDSTMLYAFDEPHGLPPEQLHQYAGKSIFVKQEYTLKDKSDLAYELYRAVAANEFEEELPPGVEKTRVALHSRYLVEPGKKEFDYFPVQLCTAPTQKDNSNLLYLSPLLAPLIVLDTATCLPYWVLAPVNTSSRSRSGRSRARIPSKHRIKKPRLKKGTYRPPAHKSVLRGI